MMSWLCVHSQEGVGILETRGCQGVSSEKDKANNQVIFHSPLKLKRELGRIQWTAPTEGVCQRLLGIFPREWLEHELSCCGWRLKWRHGGRDDEIVLGSSAVLVIGEYVQRWCEGSEAAEGSFLSCWLHSS